MIKLNQCVVKWLKDGDYESEYKFEEITWRRRFMCSRIDELMNEINEYVNRQTPNQIVNISIWQIEWWYLLSVTMRADERKERIVKNEDTLDNVKRIMKQNRDYCLRCTDNVVSLIYTHRKLICLDFEESLKSLAI